LAPDFGKIMNPRIAAVLTRVVHYFAWPGLLVASLLGLVAFEATGAELPWQNAKKFEITASNRDVKDVLQQLTTSYGIPAVIDDQIKGSPVDGKFSLTPQSMLDTLAANYRLIWFFDGSVLYVSPAGSATSEVLKLPSGDATRLRRSLQQLGVVDERYPLAIDTRNRVLRVSGPRQYVDLVKQAVRNVNPDDSGEEGVLRMVRLKYATAADYVFNQGGKETRVAGVVSTLRSMFPAREPRGQGAAFAGGDDSASRVSGRRIPVKGTSFSVPEPPDTLRTAQDLSTQVSGALAAIGGGAAGSNRLPQFSYDQRLNAVIIRDSAERMSRYDDILRTLDVRSQLVEIEVRIIEVGTDELDSLGVDWRLRSGRVDVQTGRGPLPTLNFDNALNSGGAPFAAGVAAGAVASTILGDAGRFLIARVNALAQNGKATLLSSPKVVTIENLEAVLDNSSTFYVRVAGTQDAQLYQVNFGTSLRVTPQIVDDPSGRQIRLSIRAEDGEATGEKVDQIPVVRRNLIVTQSFIREGQALLIAGLTQETSSRGETAVPGLSKLPVIGGLFRSRDARASRIERMVLITPRVVEP
jgi:type III secretion protein C